MKKNKADLVGRWLEKARRDILTARTILKSQEPFTDIICFHAQQAAEKSVKAYLIWTEAEFPKTHSLEDLILLASLKDGSFFELTENASALTPYAVEVRYGDSDVPLFDDAAEAVRIAGLVYTFVLGKIPAITPRSDFSQNSRSGDLS